MTAHLDFSISGFSIGAPCRTRYTQPHIVDRNRMGQIPNLEEQLSVYGTSFRLHNLNHHYLYMLYYFIFQHWDSTWAH